MFLKTSGLYLDNNSIKWLNLGSFDVQNQLAMKKITLLLMLSVVLFWSFSALAGNETERGDRSWSILQSWDIPGKASGLAFDGTYLYFGIYGADGDHFYRFDPANGNITQQFINPSIGDCFGMTWDGSSLWVVNQVSPSSAPAQATELNLSGTILSTFDLPDHYMSGIAHDAGDFWVGTYYPDPGTVYQVNGSGSVQAQFTPPADQIWDICMQGNNLWMVDYNADMIYKTNQSGTILESHETENMKPSGIVYDGTYIWYVDGQLSSPSKLYKVSLTGAGTPEINIPVNEHDYGIVTVGASSTWNMQVQNIGDAALIITGVTIPGSVPISTSFSTPYTIQPGASAIIPLTYAPMSVGALDTEITIVSSDPITPSETVSLTGNAVNSGPSLHVPVNSHNYGLVRMNAYTRWFLEIQNVGDATLSVSQIESDNASFLVDESVEYPIQIAPLEIIEVGLWFNPVADEMYNGKMLIYSNDAANNPYLVTLSGEGNPQQYPIGDVLWHYTITTGYDPSPKAIAPISDITGDLIDDVIVCSEDYYVRCFNGNSSGIADVMWEYEIYSGNVYDQPGLTTIKDIDGDGHEDVIVGTTGGDHSIRALSGKTGISIWRHNTNDYGGGGWVYDVDAQQDYNGDGLPDVLAGVGDDSEDMGPKRVYCLDATNGQSIWETPIGGPVFSVMAVEDFTGDGQPDAIAGASNNEETQGKIVGIDGSNGSIVWTKNTGGTSVWALMQLDDITGDGVKDVAAGDFGGNFYYIDPTNNTQIFHGSINGALILRFEKMEDVNGDGYSDLLVASSTTNGIVLSGLDGSTIWFKSLADKSWNVAVVDDLNDDAINDVLIGTLYSSNYCYFLNGVDGETLKSLSYPSPVDALNGIPDIVGDGTMEMVAGGREGEVYCFSGGLGLLVGMEEPEAPTNEMRITHYPNPFSDQIIMAFELNEDSFVEVKVYDIKGKTIRTLLSQHLSPGSHVVVWNGEDQTGKELPSGFYFYEISTNKGSTLNKVIKM